MKKGDIFLHPVTKEKCEVTRFYGNKSWYFKVVGKNKEIRAVISADQVTPYSSKESFLHFLETTGKIEDELNNYKPIPVGTKVKLNVDEILSTPIERTETFKNFLNNNRDTVFTVKETSPYIVFLQETVFTFWEHHLIVLSNDIEKL